MKRCPITYDVISDNEHYSRRGLHLLAPQLNQLKPLELNAAQLRHDALARVGKMSIQGVQPKLSAQLKVKAEQFEIVDRFGHFILKPQSDLYAELPENEALTMTLATVFQLDVPVHGLVYSKDNSMTYFVKRFDRYGHKKKFAQEDFAQLLGERRDTKYRSSMEKVVQVINTFCTFPKIELLKLFKLTLFNFLVGNEDMHLKNFSLLTRDGKVLLAPAYDLLNSSIAIGNAKEELALPLNGKKNNLTQQDFLRYFGEERLGLNAVVINEVMRAIALALPTWRELITISFLSKKMQTAYLTLLDERARRLRF